MDVTTIESEVQPGAPLPPESVAEVGVRQGILEDLTLKTLYLNGSMSLRELSAQMRLGFAVVNELLRRLRTDHLLEVTGMTGNIPQIAITTNGRERAVELLNQNQYAGAAPVSLESYVKRVKLQSVRDTEIHPPEVQRAFAHLVLEPTTLKKLGAALNSGTSIFLYGPSGTGKTTIATALSNVVSTDTGVGSLCGRSRWTDHHRLRPPPTSFGRTESDPQTRDARWVLCQRPTVLVGGELTAEMLDLQFNAITKFYVAPAQMKANNGVLIIDDFGRQRLRPEELLNRWVVPLDRRIDFLTLAGGRKIEVPFEMLVVFASNMDPAELVDPAFLRRIQTKIKIGEVSDEQFCEIFRRVATDNRVSYDSSIPADLIEFIRTHPQAGTPLLLSPRHRQPDSLGRTLRTDRTGAGQQGHGRCSRGLFCLRRQGQPQVGAGCSVRTKTRRRPKRPAPFFLSGDFQKDVLRFLPAALFE